MPKDRRTDPIGPRDGVRWRSGVSAACAFLASSWCAAQETTTRTPDADAEAAITYAIDAAEADGAEPRRRLVLWEGYEGPYFTIRLGGGLLWDYATFSQDEESKQQLDLSTRDMLRDFRFLLKGRFPAMPRLSYTLGYMWDAGTEEWRFRQTGLMFDFPALRGNVFLGRTKEGFSTNKVMVGYHGWTTERATVNDAFLPILADGVKWMGYVPSGKLVYSLGWFNDTRSEAESFNKNDSAFAVRTVWLPFAQEPERGVLHLALEGRRGEADDGQLRFRSKPEAFTAQQHAIDTGVFDADHANAYGIEAYYRPGPLMFGMEYYLNQVSAESSGDPEFHGGEIFAAYILTGETRPYNARGAYFTAVSPARSVFEGGPGAWELVLRYSYTDLDSGPIRGGKFWRITPMVNWHLSDNVRLEMAYGYARLDRFGLEGDFQIFQARLQLSL